MTFFVYWLPRLIPLTFLIIMLVVALRLAIRAYKDKAKKNTIISIILFLIFIFGMYIWGGPLPDKKPRFEEGTINEAADIIYDAAVNRMKDTKKRVSWGYNIGKYYGDVAVEVVDDKLNQQDYEDYGKVSAKGFSGTAGEVSYYFYPLEFISRNGVLCSRYCQGSVQIIKGNTHIYISYMQNHWYEYVLCPKEFFYVDKIDLMGIAEADRYYR
jgi:hypothetical protein